ncbi:myb family transcription factor [Pochonia chlamydosporia 170]|uniref:Myb family transcription factor n=1 Tax=Pochonia chlamydosporia 170 TaxID=1380566 RepID=A0A179F1I5_METCM|nr:myb family transcription factor [Pochonia chlamydosporia 170]OAQ58943.1 myb family transcription factor [Pochonia chlamydosporia 170]
MNGIPSATLASSPSKSSDEKLDIDAGISTSFTMQPVAAEQEEPERTPVPKPLDADRLHALFSEYEKLVNGQEVPREREDSPDENNESFSDQPKPRQKAISSPTANVARKQQRGISKSKTQQRKVTSRRASRTKRALASSVHEYEYMHLGEARRASNGSVEVQVFWAPIFLPCNQLRGEQAIEEAKNLVTRKFGHAAWKREMSKFDCVGMKKSELD